MIPNFEVLRKIGGGSYGEVWLARSVTGLLRAVKVVRRRDFDLQKTFEREFEGIQRYEKVSQDHPGLVDVLHVGRNDEEGYYYYVMELADDCRDGVNFSIEEYQPRTLATEMADKGRMDVQQCARIGAVLAGALGHLHHNQLTHRDVKPSNIIFVRGQAKLADIGLVAKSGQRSFVGTEGYVPPEGPGTSRADLYSLAMVLYEMHTGKDRLEFPELPTELDPAADRERWWGLNAVICRAGSPNAKKRYTDAAEFAAALRKVAGDKPGRTPFKIPIRSAMVTASVALVTMAMLYFLKPDPPNPKPPVIPPSNGPGGAVAANGEAQPGNGGANGTNGAGNANGGPGESPAGEPGEVALNNSLKMGPPDPPEGIPEPPVAPEPPEPGGVKVVSDPPGAEVFHDGKRLDTTTPTRRVPFPAGPIELVVRLEGYRDEKVTGTVTPGDTTPFQVTLTEDNRPIPGEPWVNSLGLEFEALGPYHITKDVIHREHYLAYLDDVRRVPDTPIKGNGPVELDEINKDEFCDWLTTRDRNKGFLDEDQYYVPQSSLEEPRRFYCRVEDRLTSIHITSQPLGADIYKNGRLTGQTPLTVTEQKLGYIRVDLQLPGHKAVRVEKVIDKPEAVEIDQILERDNSLIFGKPWVNSLGQKFVPVNDHLMACVWETRVADYQAFVEAQKGTVELYSPGFVQEPDHPVTGMSYDEAVAFCEWLTQKERNESLINRYHVYRLPTDLEWSELAGLTGEPGPEPQNRDGYVTGHFPWGTEWPPFPGTGNFADISSRRLQGSDKIIQGYDDGFEKTSPVGRFQPNHLGIYDLAGNVWELVSDPYKSTGPVFRVLRGGGWASYDADRMLTSYRNALPADFRGGLYGFRCVLDNKEPKSRAAREE